HLAAVSTIVADHPKRWRAAFVGTCWGLGHSVALLVVGALLLAWRGQLPGRWTDMFELGVSVMLIGLGIRRLRRSLRASGTARAALLACVGTVSLLVGIVGGAPIVGRVLAS